jgi:ribonuclease HI
MKKEHIRQMGTDRMILRHVYDKPFIVRFPEKCMERQVSTRQEGKANLVHTWLQDQQGYWAGVYSYGTRWKLSFNLEQYTTVFQAEVHAIKACAVEHLDRKYRNIYILSDSQAAIKALDKYQIISKLVWDCHQSLVQLAKHNRVQLIWVSGHESIVGNETADQLAKLGSDCLFIGPEPACGISVAVIKRDVRD